MRKDLKLLEKDLKASKKFLNNCKKAMVVQATESIACNSDSNDGDETANVRIGMMPAEMPRRKKGHSMSIGAGPFLTRPGTQAAQYILGQSQPLYEELTHSRKYITGPHASASKQ